MKRFATVVAMLAALMMVSNAHAATAVNWTGVAGAQWDLGNNFNGTTAALALGSTNGWTAGVQVNPVITLNGPSAFGVVYDGEFLGDFRMNSQGAATGSLVVSGGATLALQSGPTTDGKWTQIDAKGVTVTGPGSKLSRTTTVSGNNGGAFVWGSWRSVPNQVIDIKVLKAAELRNEGQIWFGTYNDSARDLAVTLEIGRGALVSAQGAVTSNGPTLDNTAGAEGEINFIYNWDPNGIAPGVGATDNSTYAIDFTADGLGNHGGRLSVPVGPTGIRVQKEISPGIWTSTQRTYQQLWNDGILLYDGKDKAANGGAAFGTFFSATTTLIAPIVAEGVAPPTYAILTSIAGAVEGGSDPGDINGDFTVNAADAGIMFANWGLSSGTVAEGNLNGDTLINAADAGVMFAAWTFLPATPLAAAGVPEPTTLALAALSLCGMLATRRRRAA